MEKGWIEGIVLSLLLVSPPTGVREGSARERKHVESLTVSVRLRRPTPLSIGMHEDDDLLQP